MARIPESEIERLKQEISLQRLVEARGVALKKHGSDLIGKCPFHEDNEPSLVITPENNLWHCLGACQTGGTVIDWVMKSEGVSFRHAAELLREGAQLHGTGTGWGGGVAKQCTQKKLQPPVDVESKDSELLSQVMDYYHETLKQSPEALSYLESRGLVQSEMLTWFKLGFSNRTLGYRLPMKNRQAGAEMRTRLQDLGILRQSGHEHFNGSLVIPVFDEVGQLAEMYGRKITSGLRKGTPLHLYLPGPHKGVWNREALQATEEIILCESLIDALTFWCAGFRNVTASYGIEGFTTDHQKAFEEYGTQKVLIAYDRDKAGDQAAEELSKKLISQGIDCFRVQFPKGMDANEYALKVQPARKSLDVLLRNALWMGKGTPKKPAAKKEKIIEPENVVAQDETQATDEPKRNPAKLVEDETAQLGPEAQPEANNPSPSLAAETQATREPTLTQSQPQTILTDDKPKTKSGTEEVSLRYGNRRWRIRGLAKNLSFDQMKVNVLVAKLEDPSVNPAGVDAFHVDTFDLYSARHRSGFVKQAAAELSLEEKVIKKDLGKVLLALEDLQEKEIQKALEPKTQEVVLSDKDKAAGLALLKDPNLLQRILTDFEKCGVVGEETNKLVGYLAAVSRKLEKPLAVVIQSSSAAGKSSLMEAILAFLPKEEQVKYSAMTGQSLFYMGETDLKHKILAIVEEEGAERAAYALKLLQSEGELTIASTGKDPQTGRLETQEYRVEGPVMIFLTTTAIEIDEELQNRCIVLTVDEGREQTRAIHRLQRQRQSLDGLWVQHERKELIKLHQNAQRLLRPLYVKNPYAKELTFLDDRTRMRRDHEKYLTLIEAVTLLHQYQRPVKSARRNTETKQYIEVTLGDIEVANHLCHQVLGRSLDELAPQTRRLLNNLDEMVAARCEELSMDRCDYRFSRRQVREYGGWSYNQLRVHLERLVELEYVLVHHGGRGQSFVYELLFDGKIDSTESQMMGLIDVQALRSKSTTKSLGGESGGFVPPLSPHCAPIVPPLWGVENRKKQHKQNELEESLGKTQKTTAPGTKKNSGSHTVLVDPNTAPSIYLSYLAATAKR